jgi:membrane-associated phospholipid phosphatase
MKMKRSALVITFCSLSCLSARSQIPLATYFAGGVSITSPAGAPAGFSLGGFEGSLFLPDNLQPANPPSFETTSAARTGLGLGGLFSREPYRNALEYRDRHALEPLSIVIPATAITYGLVALHKNAVRTLNVSTAHEIEEDDGGFHTRLDSYLQFGPATVVIGLNIAGVRGEHDFTDELCIYALSSIITAASVWSVKNITHEQRPDHSSFNSFPSGHAATAFASAEWLREEYPASPWAAATGYAAAATTAALRVYNNRHWVSDVIAGAAFGFLSTRMAYALNPWMERHILKARRGRDAAAGSRQVQ